MIQPEGTDLWISQQHLSVTSHQSVWCVKQETVIGNQMDFKLGLPQFRIFYIIFVLLIYMLFDKSKNKYYCLKAYYYMDDFYLITFMELWNQGQSNLQTMSTPREVPSTTCTQKTNEFINNRVNLMSYKDYQCINNKTSIDGNAITEWTWTWFALK